MRFLIYALRTYIRNIIYENIIIIIIYEMINYREYFSLKSVKYISYGEYYR